MKVIVVGAGRRGFALAKYMIENSHDVVLIDDDYARVEHAKDKLDCLSIYGSGTDMEMLKAAGVENADSFVAVTDKDEVNLISCGIANSLFSVKKTVATVANLEYTGTKGLNGMLFGINYIINSEEEVAKNIVSMIERGIYSDIISFQNSPLMLYNLEIQKNNPLINKRIRDIKLNFSKEFIIAALSHEGEASVPSGNTVIKEKDVLSLVIKDSVTNDVITLFNQNKPKPKKIILVGATHITRLILSFLPSSKRANIVVIDESEKECTNIVSLFPEVRSFVADLTSENVIMEEKLNDYDLLIALENSDELNTILACYAKKCGIKHSIALIKHMNNYASLVDTLNIDKIVSITESVVMSLLSLINDDNVSSIHSIFSGQVEICEITIEGTSSCVGKKLKDLDMKNIAIIAGASSKDGSSVIPDGNYTLCADDSLLVVINKGYQNKIKEVLS